MTRRRGQRSTHAPAGSPITRKGTQFTAVSSATMLALA